MKEALLAGYDDLSQNPNILNQLEAVHFGHEYIGKRLVIAAGKVLEGYISLEVVRVKDIEVRPVTHSQGQIIALCEHLEGRHRHLNECGMEEVAS